MTVNGDGCPHGDPACTCLDQVSTGWQPAILMVQTATSGTMNTGTSLPPPINSPTLINGPVWNFPPMTGVELEVEQDFECKDGHSIGKDTIRFTRDAEGEEEITGRCIFCECEIFLPHVVGGMMFEKAGAAVGRAMTLHDGDGEKIGTLLADLSHLEREISAEIARYKRALGMIEIARDLAEQRAIAGMAA